MRRNRFTKSQPKETVAAGSIIRQSSRFFVARTYPQGRIRIGELSVRSVTSNLPSFHDFATGCLNFDNDAFDAVCAAYLDDACGKGRINATV